MVLILVTILMIFLVRLLPYEIENLDYAYE